MTEREALLALADAAWAMIDQVAESEHAGEVVARSRLALALGGAEAVLGRVPPLPKAPVAGAGLDGLTFTESVQIDRQGRTTAHEELAQAALVALDRLEVGLSWVRFWGGVPRPKRQALADKLIGLLREALRLAEFAQGPLPDTDLCVCRACGTVRLPDWPWGPAVFRCCRYLWGYHPTWQAKILPANFWSKNRPGDRVRGTQTNPTLDGRGKPEA